MNEPPRIRRKRIVIDARILFTSTGRYVERLLHHLQDLDSENEYVVLLRAAGHGRWHPRAPNVTTMVADVKPYGFAEQWRFARLLYGLRADLVHFTVPNHPLLYRGPHVVTVHDLTLIDFVNELEARTASLRYRGKRVVFRGAMWWTARRSDALITPTRYVRDQLIRRLGAPGPQVHVTPEGADPLADDPEPTDRGQGPEYLLSVGNAYPYKNLWRLIEAFRELARPGLRLLLVGPPDMFYEELERRTEAAGVQGVVFAGFVPDDELAWLYQHARLFVFPSMSEGFGLPGLEAMRYGLPVLSSNASCLPEVYGDGAEYFDPTDTTGLARTIGRLLEDEERLGALRRAGAKVVARYSWRRMAEQTLEVYEQSLDRSRSTRR